MSMDEIVAYLQSGKLDEVSVPDAYPHLTAAVKANPGETVEEVSDVVLPPDEELYDDPTGKTVYVPDEEIVDLPKIEVPESVVETIVVETVASVSKRAPKGTYDVSGLAVGEHIVYHGPLSGGRTTASNKNRVSMDAGDEPIKQFQATQVGEEVWITRKQ